MIDLVTIGVCTAAAGLFGRGIVHSGVLTGWIVQGLGTPAVAAPTPPPAIAPPRDDAEKREIAMFLAVPSAWWLDPNRWGDNPNWRDDLPRPAAPLPEPVYAPPPACPNCHRGGAGHISVTAEHGGEPSMWQCERCGCEYTRNGETKRSRKARLVREAEARAEAAAIQAEIEAARAAEEAKRLPCGCKGEVRTRAYPTGGFDMGRYAECKTCGGTWDYAPKYEDSGDPRKKVRGEVEWPNGNGPNDLPPPPAC